MGVGHVTPEELRAAGIAVIGTKTGAAAIDALLAAGLFPTRSEERSTKVIFDAVDAGIRTVQWQIEHRHVSEWTPGQG